MFESIHSKLKKWCRSWVRIELQCFVRTFDDSNPREIEKRPHNEQKRKNISNLVRSRADTQTSLGILSTNLKRFLSEERKLTEQLDASSLSFSIEFDNILAQIRHFELDLSPIRFGSDLNSNLKHKFVPSTWRSFLEDLPFGVMPNLWCFAWWAQKFHNQSKVAARLTQKLVNLCNTPKNLDFHSIKSNYCFARQNNWINSLAKIHFFCAHQNRRTK